MSLLANLGVVLLLHRMLWCSLPEITLSLKVWCVFFLVDLNIIILNIIVCDTFKTTSICQGEMPHFLFSGVLSS